MAGVGPAPAATRRRSNEPARGEWVDLLPLEEPVLPDLPERSDGEPWSERTKATWVAWRSDPVTAQWSPADVSYALDTILLYEVMTPSSASEVRLRMDGLGLTPKGKRDLRWRIGSSGDEGSRPARAPQSASKRRARLTVVN